MTPERRRLALRAASAALRLRQKARIASDQPCNVFDLAVELGVEVRLAALPSAEGIYSPGKPVIIVSSLRPPGRQAFTCAHELGHHVYGHGEQFDELVEERRKTRTHDPKEFEADCFASALLMPKTALLKGLAARGWNARNLSPEQVYRLASWLGVGYMTLIGNMNWAVALLDREHAAALEKVKIPQIRKLILGRECKQHLVVVDDCWTGRAIDAQVDDLILLPPTAVVEGAVVEPVCSGPKGCLVRAALPGVGRASISDSGWAQYLRVSRKQFAGLARFRHLEETEDE
jgi:Zn-dependent peptidase ImmA (M78 family)